MVPPLDEISTRRRTFLSMLGSGALASTSGCLGRVRSMTGWQSPEQVTLDIKTVPVDADPNALRMARLLGDWFGKAGIETTVTPMEEQQLLRDVLLNHEFDVFIFRSPPRFQEPDALYSLLHSKFAASRGWQNPFGYTDLDTDELLETQRRASGAPRASAISRLQRTVARTNPFTVTGFPDEIRAARTDRFTNWQNTALQTSYGYLRAVRTGSDRAGTEDGDDARAPGALQVVTTDKRATENLNPIAVEFRSAGIFTGLLYDSLGYPTESERIDPWLASTWSLTDTGNGPRARIVLRPNLSWHDGKPLTAHDVNFTYRFLADTTLGARDSEDEDPVPAPSYQGRSTLVSDVETVDERTIDIQFVECDPAVASRAFTVPVLPEHVWASRTNTVSLGGIELGVATEAIVTNNLPPVGSGPFRFVENEPKKELLLETFDDHFLTRDDESVPTDFQGGPSFDRLRVQAVGSDSTAVDLVTRGDADITGTSVSPRVVPNIGRSNEVDLLVDRSKSFYLVGYNARQPPLTNPRFRNALAHLIDKQHIVTDVFEGYAQPAVSPLDGTRWLPNDLEWSGNDPVTPFLGADGELDVDAARQELRDAGYRYEDGRLIEG